MKTQSRMFFNALMLTLAVLLSGLQLHAQNRRPDRRPLRETSTSDQEPQSQEIYNKVTASLRQLDYPVNQLSTGASYIPDQLMAWYTPEQMNNIEQIRARGSKLFGNNFEVVKTCGCKGKFQIELYEVRGMDAKEEGDSGSNKAAKAMGIKEEDQQDNLYVFPDIPQGINQYAQAFGTLNSFSVKKSQKTATPIPIAILDTGIDHRYQDQSVNGEPALVFWENDKDPVDGQDDPDDPFCLTDDIIGWDFVNDDNNPMDDHSHGTHLAGIVVRELRQHQPDINYQLMALKVMDANGVGNTFDAVCSILYAAEKGARVINASWGFYGGSEKLLQRAIRYAASKGAVFVNAAGNERADLAVTNYYPAEYALTTRNSIRGLMFVGALGKTGDLWSDTNIRTEGIKQDGFVATPGEDIRSLIPLHLRGKVSATKSGTSMATPVMSAIMANYIHTFPSHSPAKIRSSILNEILTTIPSKTITRYGKVYPYYPVEWLDFSP
ncbi:S8 family serine peptidase [Flavilitoribacter nigricans]|uniref:Peptidase S8/S53 domain-containing protein n=1 Tax=Flavilitoribacter nigricans (strain ATCC 23147 / DSM 23189 / NBRC 102662 / NCIMB 1420 / SS-2) TaxID=1122177 RepID=A0A2D0N5L0_FLAN2|nr:S8 family serine peptidase [Flavilitoribacter nigricans]PHN03727.1 hypothetical protein CRP01_24545 [Flavilitoribacter nigricans DSM 23189 = NBRC 102662]